jgi:hypothetical protein
MSNRPAQQFKIGGVSLALFLGEKGQSSYVFSKSYKSGEEWKHTSSLSKADLCVAKELISQALSAPELTSDRVASVTSVSSAPKNLKSDLGEDDIPF